MHACRVLLAGSALDAEGLLEVKQVGILERVAEQAAAANLLRELLAAIRRDQLPLVLLVEILDLLDAIRHIVRHLAHGLSFLARCGCSRCCNRYQRKA